MDDLFKRSVTGAAAGLIFFGSYLLHPMLFVLLLAWILVYILLWEWPRLLPDQTSLYKSWKFWGISIIYPIAPSALLIANVYVSSWLESLYPFLIAWICDMGSYFVGKPLGRHKIIPRISPGKSWEGLVGGYVFVIAGNILMKKAIPIHMHVLITSAIVTLLAFSGDIFISYLKRKAGLKDTGALLPGHGGLLDRFDSVFFVAYLLLFKFI